MSLPINLPDGRVLMLDENTGSIIGEQDPPGPNYPPHGGLAGPSSATTSRTKGLDSGTLTVNGQPYDPDNLPPVPADIEGVLTTLPDGRYVLLDKKTGKIVQDYGARSGGGDGGVSATTAYAQQQANARDAAALAEDQRQFNERYHFDKAKFNTDFVEGQRQFDQRQELDRGKTLLGLQNQPGTLYRYLHALGGNLPPQALGGTNPTLPGFNNLRALGGSSPTAPAASPAAPAAPASAAPTAPAVAPRPAPNLVAGVNRAGSAGYWDPGDATRGARFIPGTPSGSVRPLTMEQPIPALPAPNPGPASTSTGYVSPSTGLSGFNTDGTVRLAPNDPDAAGLMAKYPGKYRIGFADGGVIPEHVVGVGTESGQPYEFGEEGPEAVVPNDMFQMLMGSIKGGKMAYSEDDGQRKRSIKIDSDRLSMPKGKMNSYATGGTIGYDPNLFNPSSLPGIVQRGFNSDPGVPLFPDVGVATGGGASLIPSAQRLNSLLPSQQQSYAGFLQDEAGVQPDDVFSLAQKISSGRARGLSTPRYV